MEVNEEKRKKFMEFSEQYLTYEEYMTLGGTISKMPFNILEFEARKRIDNRTQNRIKYMANKPNEVKLCVNAMINTLEQYVVDNSKGINKNIASESIDGYSVSFITGSQVQEAIKSKKSELEDIMQTYLGDIRTSDNIPVLYLG